MLQDTVNAATFKKIVNTPIKKTRIHGYKSSRSNYKSQFNCNTTLYIQKQQQGYATISSKPCLWKLAFPDECKSAIMIQLSLSICIEQVSSGVPMAGIIDTLYTPLLTKIVPYSVTSKCQQTDQNIW